MFKTLSPWVGWKFHPVFLDKKGSAMPMNPVQRIINILEVMQQHIDAGAEPSTAMRDFAAGPSTGTASETLYHTAKPVLECFLEVALYGGAREVKLGVSGLAGKSPEELFQVGLSAVTEVFRCGGVPKDSMLDVAFFKAFIRATEAEKRVAELEVQLAELQPAKQTAVE